MEEKEGEGETWSFSRKETKSGSLDANYLDTEWEDEFLFEMWSKFWVASTETPPSWLSMPSLPVARQPYALMAIDTTTCTPST